MDNSRSLEALYQDGTGMVSLPKKSYKASIEGYDGFDDILSIDLAKSEENLAFLDTYQLIEAKNAADKIKMCKKLSANYGTRSGMPTAAATSVESLCHMMSLEANDNANAAGVNTGNEQSAEKPVDKPKDETKKKGFFKTVFGAIRSFFEKIWELFKRLISNIANLFKGKPAETPDTGNVNVNADTNANTSSQAVNKNGLDKNLNFDYISDIMALNPKGLNTAGFDKFCGNYKKTGKVISEMSSKIANHGNGGQDNHDAKEYVSKNALAVRIAISETMKVLNGTVKSEAGTDPLSRNGLATGTVDTKSLAKYLKDCEKAIKFEKPKKPGDPDANAFGVIKALFGLNRDNDMAKIIEDSHGKNSQAVVNLVKSGSFTGDVYSGSKRFASDIQKALNELSEPHNKMVETCKAWESKINTYVEGKNHDTSDFWTDLTLITGSLKVCTRFEQVVVNATAAVTSYFGKLKKLCDQVNNA